MIRRLGDTGILVELDGLDEVLALDAAVRAAQEAGRTEFTRVIDVLPAARTLMLTVPAGDDLGALTAAVDGLEAAEGAAGRAGEGDAVEIAVVYDGPDLEDVAQHTGLSTGEVIAAHTGTPWRSAFGGFAPGFFYLTDGDPRLDVPRRTEPRTAVPPGSVALAGTFSAVYPRNSPGGWQLIGRTEQTMCDSSRTPPALLAPGDFVRFVDVGGRS